MSFYKSGLNTRLVHSFEHLVHIVSMFNNAFVSCERIKHKKWIDVLSKIITKLKASHPSGYSQVYGNWKIHIISENIMFFHVWTFEDSIFSLVKLCLFCSNFFWNRQISSFIFNRGKLQHMTCKEFFWNKICTNNFNKLERWKR